MKIRIPSPLHSYTDGRSEVDAEGGSLSEILADLESRHPGLRFRIIDEQDRIRPHIRFFVGGVLALSLDHPIRSGETVQIVAALSGG